jgi:tetraacyldisaccharide 4'-kinase
MKIDLEHLQDRLKENTAGAALSSVYGAITGARNLFYDLKIFPAYDCRLPVVSVGNISAGGNGKTPLVIYLAEEYQAAGFKPAILSRGYRGSFAGPVLVEKNHLAAQVGDEPLMISEKLSLPVVVAKDRIKGADFIREHKLGDLIILDDGFQHRRLKRNIDIVTVNAATVSDIQNFIDAKLLPGGLFRESRDKALERADVVILSSRSSSPLSEELSRKATSVIPKRCVVAKAVFIPKGIFSINGGKQLSKQPVYAFSAIANPEGFFQTIQELGFEVKAKKTFHDHYHYMQDDISLLLKEAKDLPLICTAKDAVKLRDINKDSARIYVLDADLIVQGWQVPVGF